MLSGTSHSAALGVGYLDPQSPSRRVLGLGFRVRVRV